MQNGNGVPDKTEPTDEDERDLDEKQPLGGEASDANSCVKGCVWKLVLNFGSPKSVLGNPHHEVRKSQNTFKKAFA